MRANYCGLPLDQDHNIDTELVSNVVSDLTHGKAVDINGLSAEHLHVLLPSVFMYYPIKNLSVDVNMLPRTSWF